MFYSERRSFTGWCAQLTPEVPHNAAEGDNEQVVRSLTGEVVKLRRVRLVPDHLTGAAITIIRAELFSQVAA